MIFLTLGTQQPFDRLVAAVDDWCARTPGARVFGQITEPAPTGYRPQHFEWVAHMPPADYQQRFAEADFVVAHAGMGTIITALGLAKTLLVMPRRADLGEQRNDHQLATARRFGDRPGIVVAHDRADVVRELDRLSREPRAAAPSRLLEPFADERLVGALRTAIAAGRGIRPSP